MLIHWEDQRILVVTPHVDDEVHCAGTIHRAIQAGSDVRCAALSLCAESLPDGFSVDDIRNEWAASMGVLGIKDRHLRDFPVRRFDTHRQAILEELVRHHNEFKPSVVLCPASTDAHQDHRVVYEECERLFRNCTVLGYLHPRNMREIHPNLFVGLTQKDMAAKRRAWGCYRSQIVKGGPNGDERFEWLCRSWADMGRCCSPHAEAYEFIGGVVL